MDGEQAQALRNRKRARSLKLLVPAGVIAVFLVVALFPEWFARYSYSQMHPSRRLEGPSADFWFGTDSFGRDTYTRVIVGTRISNGVAAGAVVVAVVGGVVLGVAGGLSRT
ncbi:MAG TPA: ABC transporter permease, partial [Candidatus Methylomirabilis sp.]|nr:ABC transporter permease [Candidatus Methylomirabilis sp.]